MRPVRPDLRYPLPSQAERLILRKAVALGNGNIEPLRPDIVGGSVQQRRSLRAAAELYRRMVATGRPMVSQIARDLGLSPEELSRQFGRILGITPHSLRSALRAVIGAQLLLRGWQARQVALSLGYTDPSAFTRSFRKLFPITPSKVRRTPEALELGAIASLPIPEELRCRCESVPTASSIAASQSKVA